MKKLITLLSIFILASCQKEEVQDANYFACDNIKSFTYYKIDMNKKSIEMLGSGILFDKNWRDNGLYIGADHSSEEMSISFNKLTGELNSYEPNEDAVFGKDLIQSRMCEPIEPLLN